MLSELIADKVLPPPTISSIHGNQATGQVGSSSSCQASSSFDGWGAGGCGSFDCVAVLTRSGMAGRGQGFGLLRDTLLAQDFPGIRHVISTQNASCSYLPWHRHEPEAACSAHGLRTSVVRARHILRYPHSTSRVIAGRSRCPWAWFVHDMADYVANSSWMMVLDDDVKFIRRDAISNVMRYALRASADTIFLQPTFVGPERGSVYVKKDLWPMDHDAFGKRWRDASTLHMRVDMSNLVFHRSMMSRLNLSGRCGEDKELFRKLLQVGGKMRVLNATTEAAAGIWANYKGAGLTGGAVNALQVLMGEVTQCAANDTRKSCGRAPP